MTVGTKSVLFGAHCFFIHPFFVAAAWSKLYGFPRDPRLWLAFFVHDLGYVGLPNMDGPEGEEHVVFGAQVMHFFCDRESDTEILTLPPPQAENAVASGEGWECLGFYEDRDEVVLIRRVPSTEWRDFALYHSRFYAKKDRKAPSRLCMADKLSFSLEPWWFYLLRVWLSGELWEYLARAESGKYAYSGVVAGTEKLSLYQKIRAWHRNTARHMADWAYAHKDGDIDTWTPSSKGRD